MLQTQNKETGCWQIVIDPEMPRDARIDFIFMPTYYAAAILLQSVLAKPAQLQDKAFAAGIQMAQRCPEAKLIGQAYLPNFELCFRRSISGAYASVDECKGSWTPIVIWSVSKNDLARLDRYEGYGRAQCYGKEVVTVQLGQLSLAGLIYRLPAERPLGLPRSAM